MSGKEAVSSSGRTGLQWAEPQQHTCNTGEETRYRTAAPLGITDLCAFLFNVLTLQIRRKNTETEEDEDQSEKKFRKCEKSGCPATYPVCFASASERCVCVCEFWVE